MLRGQRASRSALARCSSATGRPKRPRLPPTSLRATRRVSRYRAVSSTPLAMAGPLSCWKRRTASGAGASSSRAATRRSSPAVPAASRAGLAAWLWSQADMSNLGQLGFANQLKIPPLLEPRQDGAGRKVFDLRLQQGTSELLAGKPTQSWGANGSYLGPTIRATRGDQVVMQVTNHLPEPTTIHWHGMHLPAAADGGPHQPIQPASTWSPTWRIDQPAATLWYHPHLHGRTEDHVYRGVAGLFLLDDPEAAALPLPNRYGVDDIPVILQDKRFDREGNLDVGQSPFSPIGRLGDQLLVNGTHDPHLNIRHQRVRLRLLNASTARVYNVGFADDRPFELIGQGL